MKKMIYSDSCWNYTHFSVEPNGGYKFHAVMAWGKNGKPDNYYDVDKIPHDIIVNAAAWFSVPDRYFHDVDVFNTMLKKFYQNIPGIECEFEEKYMEKRETITTYHCGHKSSNLKFLTSDPHNENPNVVSIRTITYYRTTIVNIPDENDCPYCISLKLVGGIDIDGLHDECDSRKLSALKYFQDHTDENPENYSVHHVSYIRKSDIKIGQTNGPGGYMKYAAVLRKK